MEEKYCKLIKKTIKALDNNDVCTREMREAAIQAMKEVQPKLVNMIYELDAYRKIGSISECAAAVSYQNPATMIFPKGDFAICPICDHGVRITDKYCSNCGQKLTRKGWKETKKGETVG